MDLPEPSPDAVRALAPTGRLRAAINLANFLLVTGRSEDGDPEGVSPDMAGALADQLGVDLELLRYKTPGAIADDGGSDAWDIGNIGAEPKRAEQIAFTAAYCEIEATYLVPAGSDITSIDQVDQPGRRIASPNRAAYDLWLERNLQHAERVPSEGLGGALDLFLDEGLDALAGLRPGLLKDIERVPGGRILEGRFTAVQQAMGTPRSRDNAGFEYLTRFVEAAKASGLVASLIDKHGVNGLSVAPPSGD
ncbi:MAG: transporter substrate-binding domain-containing protein [Actinomycetota bacterium]